MISILFVLLAAFSAQAAEMPRTDYEHVAAGQSNQKLGPVGGQGDVLERLVIVPETTGAGSVTISDGGGLSRTVFVTGTLSDLHPIIIELGARSVSGDWSVTTGSNVHVIAVGRFK
jgi:hypothetical protein